MLEHLHGCRRQRAETYTWHGATVTRCMDCGAHNVDRREEPVADDGVRFEPAPAPLYTEVRPGE
jgi:hypothetical protein